MATTGAEIASAYVSLRIKMPGVQGDIVKNLGGIDMPSIGQRMGSRLSDGMKKALKASAVAVGGVLAAGIGTALVKGFARLDSLDQATAKLRGLGHSADAVDAIMQNALASVKGTSFGLDAAATTAAGAVAAGIKPGKELEGVLKSVANSAAAAGAPMEEFGSIYNKVASLGKAQNDALQQVADRGLPIYQALATQLGVTTDEVFKMASAGKIGFAEFEQAMTSAAGNVAAEMGGTVRGSWANFMASLGRIGAGALGGVWSSVAPVLQATTNAMGPLEDVAARVGEKLGTVLAPAIEWLITMLNNGVDFSVFSPLGLIFEALAPVLPVVSEALKLIAGVLGDVLGKVLPPLMPVLEGLAGVFSDLVVGVLPPLVAIFEALAPVIDLVGTVIQALAPVITPLVSLALMPLMLVLKPLTPLFKMLGKVIEPVAKVIDGLLTPVIGWMSSAMESMTVSISGATDDFIPKLGSAFTAVWNVIKPVIDWFASAFQWLWGTILEPIFTAIKWGFAVLGGILQGVYDTFIKPTIEAIAAVFQWVWTNIVSPIIGWIQEKLQLWGLAMQIMWTTYIKPALDAVGAAFQWIWNTIISPVVEWIKQKLNLLGLGFRIMYEQYIRPAWDAVSSKIQAGWQIIKGIIDTMVRVVQSDPKRAFEAARDAIGTAWAGIQELAKKPVRFVIETVINGLINTVNKLPGVNIPTVPLPKGFARGGIIPGMSRMSDGDDQLIMARRGEGMMVSEALRTSADRAAFLAANAAGRRGVGFASMLQGFARGGLVNPLPKGSYSVSQPYHGGHNGIDLAAASGTKVMAAGRGVVGLAGVVPMGGNEIYIQHPNGLGTRYSHLSGFATSVGANVRAGQVIGYVGSTGMSTGPHLHYMVHSPGGGGGNYGNHVNPASYMGVDGEAWSILDGIVDWATNTFKSAFPSSDLWVDMAGGLMKQAVKSAVDAISGGFGTDDMGTTLYDSGGWLPTGMSLVENRSGRPEPILTGAQWDSLLEGRNSAGEKVLHVYDSDGVLLGTMKAVADERIDTAAEEQDAARRRAGFR